jgi:hypothetical protein
MRRPFQLPLILALLTPHLAIASEADGTPPPAASPAPSDALPHFGLSAAAGVPDGMVLSGLYRPVDFLRLSAGGSWNYFGYGLQGGLGLVPFQWPIAPTFNLEVGHYFDSDLRWLASQNAGFPADLKPLLERVGYSYANAQLGIEVGSSRRFALFVRAGISYFWTTIHGVSQVTNTYATTSGSQTATVRIADPQLRATMPSVKLGILFYL